MRPLLALTQRVIVAQSTGEKRDCLAHDWQRFLAALGIRWIALPNDPEEALALAEHVDVTGVILTGGDDIGVFPERDATETALVAWCGRRSRPLLGICRGMQFLHHVHGGALKRVNAALHVATHHRLEGMRAEGLTVNSYHNFSPDFDALPQGYPLRRIAVCAEDGAVEAVEGPGQMGMMWHPERESPPRAEDLALLKEWFRLS